MPNCFLGFFSGSITFEFVGFSRWDVKLVKENLGYVNFKVELIIGPVKINLAFVARIFASFFKSFFGQKLTKLVPKKIVCKLLVRLKALYDTCCNHPVETEHFIRE